MKSFEETNKRFDKKRTVRILYPHHFKKCFICVRVFFSNVSNCCLSPAFDEQIFKIIIDLSHVCQSIEFPGVGSYLPIKSRWRNRTFRRLSVHIRLHFVNLFNSIRLQSDCLLWLVLLLLMLLLLLLQLILFVTEITFKTFILVIG